ncbi:Heterokaryon incompatibility domain-containing protein [Madurella fahalii]|uniref:Heterokaryon incompatibility domain-containing protein n=1 Tax=Madurella fahalii TaxID=1157608 RepID=A0ABQ0GT48_9PEZI
MAAYSAPARGVAKDARPGRDKCAVCFDSKSIGLRLFWAAQSYLNSTHDPQSSAATRASQLLRWKKAGDAGCLTCRLAFHCRSVLGFDAHFSWHGDASTSWELFILLRDGQEAPHGIKFPTLSRFPCGSTASEDALEWTRSRLSACEERHRRCDAGSDPFLPTRLIDLAAFVPLGHDSGPVDVVLRNTADVTDASSARYVALSHCWGGLIPDCQTTRDTLVDRQTRIPWQTMPRTFQDAAHFARRLGIRYLWIDSVCIIQRDVDDWLRESSKMYGVYGHAYLTLAAAHAQNGNGGLYALSPDATHILTVPLAETEFDVWARPRFRHLYARDVDSFEIDTRQDLPLVSRAWTYQERVVSPRVLYFTQNELAWECFEALDCECGQLRRGFTTLDMGRSFEKASPKSDFRSELDKEDTRVQLWRRIVSEYTSMGVTMDYDRLPALSAIAREFQGALPDEKYLAGMWSGPSLPEQLLWYVADNRPRGRPAKWCPPTWSWASIQARAWRNQSADPPLFTVIDASCEYLDKTNPLGIATGGRLTIQGRLLTATIITPKQRLGQSATFYEIKHGEHELVLHLDIDVGPPSPEGQPTSWASNEVVLLAGSRKLPPRNPELTCICLQQSEQGRYKRFGIAILASLSSWDTIEAFYGKFSAVQEIILE